MDLKKKAPTWLVVVIGLPVIIFALNSQSKNGSSTTTSRSKAEVAAISVCRAAIQNRAVFPSSVDFHSLTGVGTDLGGAGGKPRVSMDFDAKNSVGNMLPYQGLCDFSSDPPAITISNR
jgi:hypothetical protein